MIGVALGGKKGALKGALIGGAVGGVSGFIVGNYREQQYKTAKEVYKENPNYAKKQSANMPPEIKNIRAYVTDENNRPIQIIKNGEKVWLCTKYDIVIPKYAAYNHVDVKEQNYLIDPSGTEMDKNELTRVKPRESGGVDAGINLTIPRDLPSGTYVHVANIFIDGKKYERQQKIQIARINDSGNLLAIQ